jgi:hypothetical protein
MDCCFCAEIKRDDGKNYPGFLRLGNSPTKTEFQKAREDTTQGESITQHAYGYSATGEVARRPKQMAEVGVPVVRAA